MTSDLCKTNRHKIMHTETNIQKSLSRLEEKIDDLRIQSIETELEVKSETKALTELRNEVGALVGRIDNIKLRTDHQDFIVNTVCIGFGMLCGAILIAAASR